MRDATSTLAAAFRITEDERYANKACQLLQVFFVDEATRMKPELDHAQVMVGKPAPKRGIGLIDTLHLIEVPMSIQALRGSSAMTPELEAALTNWFRDYLEWLVTSPRGEDEGRRVNNHAVAFWLQVAAFNQLVEDPHLSAACRQQFQEKFVSVQMAEDGSFPWELKRTKPYAYSIFQLDNMVTLCWLLSAEDPNLWDYQGPQGQSMRTAVEYLFPYIEDKSKWPHQPDVQAWEGWPVRQSHLLLAGLGLKNEAYIRQWRTMQRRPESFELRRNNAITQPLLWILP